jgi:sporulation protein YlmC with PRC-barrel domain
MKSVTTAIIAGIAGAILLSPTSAPAQPHQRQRLQSEIRSSELHNLTGLTVENLDGEKLGKIKNFVLDMPSGKARYVLISSGGIVTLRPHTKLVPASAVSTATAKKGTALLDISIKNWAKAPLFKRKDLASLNQSSRYTELVKFYSHSTEPAIRKNTLPEAHASEPNRKQTGDAAKGASSAPLQLATDIVGKNVINRQNEALGKVSDLVFDVSAQKPTFAIISMGGFLKKDQMFAVQLRALNSSDFDKLALDANQKIFEQSGPFDEKAWQSASTSNAGAIYRFEIP